MIFDHEDPVGFLKEQLEERTKANPSYSLRAFARKLGLSPGGLSLILSNKKRLSADRAADVARALDLKEREAEYFIHLSQLKFAKSAGYRTQILEKLFELRSKEAPSKNWTKAALAVDQFKLISEWYGLPCLELITETPGPWSPRKVAESLDITQAEADAMIERLKRLKLVDEVSTGVFERKTSTVVVESAVPNEAIRSYYESVQRRSEESIHKQDPSEKSIGAQVFAADPADLPQIKKLTDDYLSALNELAARGKNRTIVYQAVANVFRLSTPTGNKTETKTEKKQTDRNRKENLDKSQSLRGTGREQEL
jgi:uncharacterized protein (TIGR02147 family)